MSKTIYQGTSEAEVSARAMADDDSRYLREERCADCNGVRSNWVHKTPKADEPTAMLKLMHPFTTEPLELCGDCGKGKPFALLCADCWVQHYYKQETP